MMKTHIAKTINEWDPMGFVRYSSINEYEPEIHAINHRHPQIESDEHLATIIDEIFRQHFGRLFCAEFEACLGVAIEILHNQTITTGVDQ